MIQTVRGLSRSILNIVYKTLFPLKCAACAKEGSFLCRRCESKLRYLGMDEQTCIACARPNPGGFTHDACAGAAAVGRLISCFAYKEPVSSLVIMGKYSFMPEVFGHLAQLATEHLKRPEVGLDNLILCPIPLSRQRQRWRGFNQSQKLCEALSQALDLPVKQYLVRQKNTKTQKDLSRAERQKNVKNCFTLTPAFSEAAQGQSVLLIDDVATTGATLTAAAEALIQAGASKVWALTIARD